MGATITAPIQRGFNAYTPIEAGVDTSQATNANPSSSGSKAGLVGLLAGGTALGVTGLALRHAGHGRLGLGLAAAGAAMLGASLLSGCSLGAAAPKPSTFEQSHQDPISISATSLDNLPHGADRTNPAPPGYRPGGAAAQGRAGVVEVMHQYGTGSGWVVAPHRIITNHHVIDGVDSRIQVRDSHGRDHDATVIASDRAHDLAMLRVDDLDDAPLPLDDAVDGGELAETTGYPGGAFHQDAATARATVTVHDGAYTRPGTFFSGTSAPGVSGGPIINGAGDVVATAFAVGSMPAGSAGAGPFVMGIPNDQVRAFVAANR
ncbi:MAG: serine protease [Thermoleophilia bacterium]|nr:serine protease [Thermoleophilia bacterium]